MNARPQTPMQSASRSLLPLLPGAVILAILTVAAAQLDLRQKSEDNRIVPLSLRSSEASHDGPQVTASIRPVSLNDQHMRARVLRDPSRVAATAESDLLIAEVSEPVGAAFEVTLPWETNTDREASQRLLPLIARRMSAFGLQATVSVCREDRLDQAAGVLEQLVGHGALPADSVALSINARVPADSLRIQLTQLNPDPQGGER